ncbi:G-protein coupled receptor family C group 6 member A-like isoform X1 [Oncorhynchus keta]|uniref:G-protein coupled receptor family C group 6 member A-like isoform X1 n=2 Tax=Oncorhynchus keta TaxID=8018 RepID=UPI00227A66CA|nr:G-protein coupled receptor family C group 6 member A-like isoform X1 [Oncorhynchus keta]
MWVLLLLIMTVTSIVSGPSCSVNNNPRRIYVPGDIVVGGLFPIYLQVKTNWSTIPPQKTCTDYDVQMFLRSQVMIYAIQEINRSQMLPNVSVGYEIYDTCGDVTNAIRATLSMMEDIQGKGVNPNVTTPHVKVVIGERYSEKSIAVARLLALPLVAQISYSSTSELLSRKCKFPSFLRTVSSDEHQTIAIAELVKHLTWESVGVIGSDDEFGKYGAERLIDHFNDRKLCVDFKEILSANFILNETRTQTELAMLMSKIRNSSAEAIVIFTAELNVRIILKEVLRMGISRIWIACDNWATNKELSEMPDIQKVGRVFGFIAKRNKVPGFHEYVRDSMFQSKAQNSFIHEFMCHYPPCPDSLVDESVLNCALPDTKSQSESGGRTCLDRRCLLKYIDEDESYYIYLAVKVIAQGLRSLLNCDNVRCKRNGSFAVWELLEELKRVNFIVDNTTHISFNQNGDPTTGYDIVEWNMSVSENRIITVGEYRPDEPIRIREHLIREFENVTVTFANCCKTCNPGYQLISKINSCCKECSLCSRGYISTGGGKKCVACHPQREYTSSDMDRCLMKTIDYLGWTDAFTTVLVSFDVLGIVVSLLVAILFAVDRRTPIVKSTGGYLSFLELLSLLACFCCISMFLGEPTKTTCLAGLPLFGMAFTVCVSCILANLLQIFVGFTFNLRVTVGDTLKRLNRPIAVVTCCSAVQVAVCVLWLTYAPPFIVESSRFDEATILLECNKGSKMLFGAMLTYIALLAVVCFLFAFKGKQLPDLYKNASFVSISMVIFLVVWMVFIPVYINMSGKYQQAIEAAAILVSNYSVLCCHFAPKCYIMLFRKELNNENAITNYIRKHYEKKGMAVVSK